MTTLSFLHERLEFMLAGFRAPCIVEKHGITKSREAECTFLCSQARRAGQGRPLSPHTWQSPPRRRVSDVPCSSTLIRKDHYLLGGTSASTNHPHWRLQ